MSGEIDRSWRDPELLVKALPSVILQTAFFLAPLLMTGGAFGIPNRTFMLAYGEWVIVVARGCRDVR